MGWAGAGAIHAADVTGHGTNMLTVPCRLAIRADW
jgi:hypothetical protein